MSVNSLSTMEMRQKPMEKGNYSIMEMMAGSHTTLGCELIQTEMPS